MLNTKNINWVDSAELKAVTINSKYGKKETDVALTLMVVTVSLISFIICSFLLINYGDMVIRTVRSFISQGNFFNIMLIVLSVISLVTYAFVLWFGINGIKKSTVGINHQVNTKASLNMNIVSISIASAVLLFFIILLVGRMILMKFM